MYFIVGLCLLFQYNECCAVGNGVTLRYLDGNNLAVAVGIDVVLHLHGLEHYNCIALLYSVAHIHLHVDDYAWQRGLDGVAVYRSRCWCRGCRRSGGRLCCRLYLDYGFLLNGLLPFYGVLCATTGSDIMLRVAPSPSALAKNPVEPWFP